MDAAAHRALSRRQRTRIAAAADDDNTTTTARRHAGGKNRGTATSDALAATTTATAAVTPIIANTIAAPPASVTPNLPIGVALSTSTLTPAITSATAAAASAGSTTSKLPTGGIVAIIVVCVVLGLAAIGFIAWRCVRRRNATRDAQAGSGFGRSMAERRSSFGNNGNIPPIYAAHANHGANAAMLNRRSTGASDERKLLGRQPSPHGSEHDYDLKQPDGPYASPQPLQPAAFAQPQPKVTAGMFAQNAAAKSTTDLYQPPPVAAAVPASATAAPPANAAAADGQTIYVVKRTFEPSLPDELVLFVGDKVIILQSFDDGWCLGANLSSSAPGQDAQRGVFPRDCVEEADPKPAGATGLSRAPTLPPIDISSSAAGYYFGSSAAPAIQVSGPDGRAKHASAADVMLSAHYDEDAESPSSVISRFPEPASRQANGLPVKRTSSLIADRDAQLMALGTALERS